MSTYLNELIQVEITLEDLTESLDRIVGDEEVMNWTAERWGECITYIEQSHAAGDMISEYDILLYAFGQRWKSVGYVPGVQYEIYHEITLILKGMFALMDRQNEFSFGDLSEMVERMLLNEIKFWTVARWKEFFKYMNNAAAGIVREVDKVSEELYWQLLYHIGIALSERGFPSSKEKKEEVANEVLLGLSVYFPKRRSLVDALDEYDEYEED